MSVRKYPGKTVYPPLPVANRIATIASEDPGASFNYYAVKFMTWGLKRWDRMQQKKSEKPELRKV